MRLPTWLIYTLVVIITAAWVTSFIASFVIKGYNPPESINLLFSTVIGALLLGRIGEHVETPPDRRRKKVPARREDDEEGPSE